MHYSWRFRLVKTHELEFRLWYGCLKVRVCKILRHWRFLGVPSTMPAIKLSAPLINGTRISQKKWTSIHQLTEIKTLHYLPNREKHCRSGVWASSFHDRATIIDVAMWSVCAVSKRDHPPRLRNHIERSLSVTSCALLGVSTHWAFPSHESTRHGNQHKTNEW